MILINRQKKGEREKTRNERLRKSIRGFVAKINKLECLPEPSSGDCFYCQMHTDNGVPLGDSFGDVDHLLSHIREGYLHGSLIFNAVKWAGYRNPGFIWSLANKELREGRCGGLAGSVKQSLKRYLYRKLGLVS